jgi:hypothetical protein
LTDPELIGGHVGCPPEEAVMAKKQSADIGYRVDLSPEHQLKAKAKKVATFHANRSSPAAAKQKAVGREHALSLAAAFQSWVGPRRSS